MPASYHRAYRARRRAAGNPVRRREGYVRPDGARGLGPHRLARFATDVEIPRFESHPLVAEAVARLNGVEQRELGSTYDSIVGDLVGEYVLAAIEGGDPTAAMDAYRKRRRFEDRALVYGFYLDALPDRSWDRQGTLRT